MLNWLSTWLYGKTQNDDEQAVAAKCACDKAPVPTYVREHKAGRTLGLGPTVTNSRIYLDGLGRPYASVASRGARTSRATQPARILEPRATSRAHLMESARLGVIANHDKYSSKSVCF